MQEYKQKLLFISDKINLVTYIFLLFIKFIMKRINIINKFKHILNRIIINIVDSQKTIGRKQKFGGG